MTMERQSLETALRQGSLTGLLRARSFPRGMNLWHWTKTVGGCVSPLLLLLQHWMAMVIPLKVVPIQIPKANSPAGKQVLEWEWRGGGRDNIWQAHLTSSWFLLNFVHVSIIVLTVQHVVIFLWVHLPDGQWWALTLFFLLCLGPHILCSGHSRSWTKLLNQAMTNA